MKKMLFVLAFSIVLFPAISHADITQNLAYGSSGIDVTTLQTFLTSQGIYNGPITGKYMSVTKAAVVKFQIKQGITPTGTVGPITRAAVAKLSATNTATVSTTLAPATAVEIEGISRLCSISSGEAQLCATPLFWNGYNSNQAFRNNMDKLAQMVVAPQTQTSCSPDNNAGLPASVFNGMTPSARILAEKVSCGTVTPTDEAVYAAQQLQGALNTNTNALNNLGQKLH